MVTPLARVSRRTLLQAGTVLAASGLLIAIPLASGGHFAMSGAAANSQRRI
jgi:hypothetical protein